MLSLGCENLTHEQFLEELGDYDKDRVKFLICQEAGDEFSEGRERLKQCAEYASQFKREPIIGMKFYRDTCFPVRDGRRRVSFVI